MSFNQSMAIGSRNTLFRSAATSFLLIILALTISACGSRRPIQSENVFHKSTGSSVDLNKRIASSAVLAQAHTNDLTYRLGAGDVVELTVFQVEELNTKLRVNGRGEIILPLMGTIDVNNLSLAEVEKVIIDKLSEEYLQDPQVSLFIEEYRSQQITVMGAVLKPDVYSIRQSRSIFEMLSLAGGLTQDASDTIRIKTVQNDNQTGEPRNQELILSMTALLEGAEAASSIRLHGGDSILVPEAGVIFVEGAVEKPGSYVMQGETNVLKAVAMAGGIPWAGKEGSIQVIRTVEGTPYAIDVNLDKVRKQKGDDVILKDGDVVVIRYSAPKRFISGFFKAAGQIFGYSLN